MSMSFIGQFHPLLIHLPIGILISGVGLYWYDLFSKKRTLHSGIEILILFSAIFGIISVITGLILSNTNDYDKDLLVKHQYSGIILTIFIVAFYISLKSEKVNQSLRSALSIGNIILVFLTGHFGGTITHGALEVKISPKELKKSYQFNDTLAVFTSMVQPILAEKCASCHGEEKQKGNLRLDNYANLVKGGKNGHTIDVYTKNEIIKRIVLSTDDEKHMPPKARTQLSSEENNIIHWWIQHGANEQLKIHEASKNDTLLAFIKSKQQIKNDNENIPFADPKAIRELSQIGSVIYSIEKNSPYLYVNLQNVKTDTSILFSNLSIISPNIIELKISGKKLNSDLLKMICGMKNIEKLDLSGCDVEDNITKFISLPSTLKMINLSNSKINQDNLFKMITNPGLEKVFAYNIDIDSSVLIKLKTNQKNNISFGRTSVPTYPSDTTLVK